MITPKTNKCCGCAACVFVCNNHAITMESNSLGFAFPKVNESQCVNCGLCNLVCPFETGNNGEKKTNSPNTEIYAVRHKDIKEIKRSRSGAAFVGISDIILRQEGVIYGAGFGDGFEIKHKRAINSAERDEFRGSKYAQSLMNVYKEVKLDLKNNKVVLFSGTPCQVKAIKNAIPNYLQSNLFSIDIICHGVASPQIWNDYLNYIERIEKKQIVSVNFRDKLKFGWSGLHRESFTFEDNKKRTYPYTYYQAFIIRECCSECPFASTDRPADITIGDFWQWQEAVPEISNDDLGVSIVMCNTSKGINLFNEAKPLLIYKEVSLQQCLQHNLKQPTKEDPHRIQFENDYNKYGFEYVRKKYWKVSKIEWIKYYFKHLFMNE